MFEDALDRGRGDDVLRERKSPFSEEIWSEEEVGAIVDQRNELFLREFEG